MAGTEAGPLWQEMVPRFPKVHRPLALASMARSKKIDIQIRKDGKHFALIVEDQLVALTVYR